MLNFKLFYDLISSFLNDSWCGTKLLIFWTDTSWDTIWNLFIFTSTNHHSTASDYKRLKWGLLWKGIKIWTKVGNMIFFPEFSFALNFFAKSTFNWICVLFSDNKCLLLKNCLFLLELHCLWQEELEDIRTAMSFGRLLIVFYDDIKRKCKR